MNTLIAGALQYIWLKVNSQQIVIMMPLFAITMPANAKVIFAVLLQIAAFDMIPVERMYDDMVQELANLSTDTLDYLQIRMESLGSPRKYSQWEPRLPQKVFPMRAEIVSESVTNESRDCPRKCSQ